MKKLACLFLFLPIVLTAQYRFDFESGELTPWHQPVPGIWEVTELEPLNGQSSLHHAYDNPSSGVDYISIETGYTDPGDSIMACFTLRHGYPPSSSNNWQFFIQASQSDFSNSELAGSAIIFGVNYNCSDDLLKLWKVKQGKAQEMLVTSLNIENDISSAMGTVFKIKRDFDGIWKLSYSPDSSKQFFYLDQVYDSTAYHGKYAGFRYAYSSSRDRNLWIDDVMIDGGFYNDTVAPAIVGSKPSGLLECLVNFTEPVPNASIYCFSREGDYPDSLSINDRQITLFFTKPFPNREKTEIVVRGIRDQEGNRLQDTVIHVRPGFPEFGDVVIHEVMADPEPAVYLPPHEYLELFNRYDEKFYLEGWILQVNNRQYIFRGNAIEPGQYLICTAEDQGGLFGNIKTEALFTSSAALPNDGAEIALYDEYHRLVHRVNYCQPYPSAPGKDEGGWSLEQVDPAYLCGEIGMWDFSEDKQGGTPGRENSVFRELSDQSPPLLSYLGVEEELVVANFNEPVMIKDNSSAGFFINKYQFHPQQSSTPLVEPSLLLSVSVLPVMNEPLSFQIRNISDCSGNKAELIGLPFGLPEKPSPNDILLSEIMYHPMESGIEYFELRNCATHWIDLMDLSYSIAQPGEVIAKRHFFSDHSHLIAPGSHVVFCNNQRGLKSEWGLSDSIDVVELSLMASLPNNGSCITIYDRSGNTLDAICYSDSLHQDLLPLTKGIALERVASGCAFNIDCWTSAAAAVGHGTPGKINSQWKTDLSAHSTNASRFFSIFPKVISPDYDGFEDNMVITLNDLSIPDYLYDIFITDLRGMLVHSVIRLGNPGTQDRYFWDGKDQSGSLVAPGIYIVHCRVKGLNGSKSDRIPCAVIYR